MKNVFEIKINRQAFGKIQKAKNSTKGMMLNPNAWIEIISNIIVQVPQETLQAMAKQYHVTDEMLVEEFLQDASNRAKLLKLIKSGSKIGTAGVRGTSGMNQHNQMVQRKKAPASPITTGSNVGNSDMRNSMVTES